MTQNFRIETITAYIAVDPVDNSEGVMGVQLPDGGLVPMIGADEKRIMELRPLAIGTAEAAGLKSLEVVQFEARRPVETIRIEDSGGDQG